MTVHIERAPRMRDAPEHAEGIRSVQQLLRKPAGKNHGGAVFGLALLLATLGACMLAAAAVIKTAPGSAVAQFILTQFH